MKLVLLSLFTGCLLLFLYNLITVLQLPQSSKSSCGDLQSPRYHFFVARERHVTFLPRKTCYVSIFSFFAIAVWHLHKKFHSPVASNPTHLNCTFSWTNSVGLVENSLKTTLFDCTNFLWVSIRVLSNLLVDLCLVFKQVQVARWRYFIDNLKLLL